MFIVAEWGQGVVGRVSIRVYLFSSGKRATPPFLVFVMVLSRLVQGVQCTCIGVSFTLHSAK